MVSWKLWSCDCRRVVIVLCVVNSGPAIIRLPHFLSPFFTYRGRNRYYRSDLDPHDAALHILNSCLKRVRHPHQLSRIAASEHVQIVTRSPHTTTAFNDLVLDKCVWTRLVEPDSVQIAPKPVAPTGPCSNRQPGPSETRGRNGGERHVWR